MGTVFVGLGNHVGLVVVVDVAVDGNDAIVDVVKDVFEIDVIEEFDVVIGSSIVSLPFASSLGGSLSSFNGGVVKFVRGLGPVQDKCLGLCGCGDALLPNCGKLGEARPPGNVAFLLCRRGNTANSSAHHLASSLLAALTNVTRSGLVSAKECGCPVTCSAPVTSNTLDISTEPCGTVSG